MNSFTRSQNLGILCKPQVIPGILVDLPRTQNNKERQKNSNQDSPYLFNSTDSGALNREWELVAAFPRSACAPKWACGVATKNSTRICHMTLIASTY